MPRMGPCGNGASRTGLFEVDKLITFKRKGMQLFPCFVSGCDQAQEIDCLLRNSQAARTSTIESKLNSLRDQLNQMENRLHLANRGAMSEIDDTYTAIAAFSIGRSS